MLRYKQKSQQIKEILLRFQTIVFYTRRRRCNDERNENDDEIWVSHRDERRESRRAKARRTIEDERKRKSRESVSEREYSIEKDEWQWIYTYQTRDNHAQRVAEEISEESKDNSEKENDWANESRSDDVSEREDSSQDHERDD